MSPRDGNISHLIIFVPSFETLGVHITLVPILVVVVVVLLLLLLLEW